MLQKYSQAFEKVNKYRNVVNFKKEVFLEDRRGDNGVSYLGKGDKQNIFQELTSELNLKKRTCLYNIYIFVIHKLILDVIQKSRLLRMFWAITILL